ncbi:MAG: hypothetical protein KTR23_11375, partial [Rhodospirillales bacterium]|nr:hypothetical protein [Rhodospirillales bacterium]
FLLINNVKELYRNRSSVPQVRVAASQRRTPSVEAGYRALFQTCKYLFEEKVHLIGFFTKIVNFQYHNHFAPSNRSNSTLPPRGPMVEKSRRTQGLAANSPTLLILHQAQ